LAARPTGRSMLDLGLDRPVVAWTSGSTSSWSPGPRAQQAR